MVQAVPVILINLDRSADRLAHMEREFAGAGMSFERFKAVDGTELPESVRSYFCDASGEVVSPLRPGEIGCYASHLAVWQRIAAGRYGPAVLVCEDDIGLPDNLPDLLGCFLTAAPRQWDVIRLSSKTKRAVAVVKPLDANHSLVRFWRQPVYSGAQLVSRRGAEKLLKPTIRHRAIDEDLMRPWLFDLDVYGVSPPPIAQNVAHSLIREMGGRRDDGVHRTLRRLYRLFSPDKVRRPAYNLRKMGLRQWLVCLAVNAGLRLHLLPSLLEKP